MEEELVRYIAENLVNNPEEVTITRKETSRAVVLELHVAPDDMGRVIGKNGRVANAVRSLLRAMHSGQHQDQDGERRRRDQRIILEIE